MQGLWWRFEVEEMDGLQRGQLQGILKVIVTFTIFIIMMYTCVQDLMVTYTFIC